MKKIIFLFIFFYSPFSFSSFIYGGVTFQVERHPEFFSDSYVGTSVRCSSLVSDIFMGYDGIDNLFRNYFNYSPLYTHGFFSDSYSNFSDCVPLGFYKVSLTFIPIVDEIGSNYYSFSQSTSEIILPSCPDGSPFSVAYPISIRSSSKQYHSFCMSDLGVYAYDGCEEGEACNCPIVPIYDAVYYLIICPTYALSFDSVSQETAIKKNDLISESNSKLGVIASTNSAITELLKQIKDALLSLNSANFGIFGTNADSSDLSNKNDPNSPEFEPELSSSEIAVSAISSSLSKNGSCPSDISISIMNSTHYLSYQPLCDFLKNIRSLVIAAARVAAAWLVIGAL